MKTLLTRMTNVLVAASAVTVLFAQPAEPDADWRAFFGTLHAHSGVSDGVERPNVAFSDEISDASSPPPPEMGYLSTVWLWLWSAGRRCVCNVPGVYYP